MTVYVSVIVPVYNDQAGIDTCLGALAAQNWPQDAYEVIVVDNSSNPPISLDSAFAHFAQLIICSKPGSYASRNVGIAAARGEMLVFTDADCVPDVEWINAGVAAFSQMRGTGIIGGEVLLSLSQNPTVVERYQYLTGFLQQANIEHLGFTATANLFVNRTQIEHIGLFDEKLLSGGDREWSWRASRAGFPVKYVPQAVVYTTPRTSLAAAIRQARRVAGGRYTLSRLSLEYVAPTGLKPHRSVGSAIKWILTHPELSFGNRIKVFAVAAILKIVHVLETARLLFRALPERR